MSFLHQTGRQSTGRIDERRYSFEWAIAATCVRAWMQTIVSGIDIPWISLGRLRQWPSVGLTSWHMLSKWVERIICAIECYRSLVKSVKACEGQIFFDATCVSLWAFLIEDQGDLVMVSRSRYDPSRWIGNLLS